MQTGTTGVIFKENFQEYIAKVYTQTAVGVGITGLVAWMIASSPALSAAIFGTSLLWVAVLAPLAMIIWFSFRRHTFSLLGTKAFYYAFTALLGVSMAVTFMVASMEDISLVFLITCGVFGGAAVYGHTTNRDLSSLGAYLLVALIGLIVAMIVNIFLQSSALMMLYSCIGVLVFVGLTAYDIQMARNTFGFLSEIEREKAVYDTAISLYLNFLNLFNMLMNIMSGDIFD